MVVFQLQPLQGPKPEMDNKQGYGRAKQDGQPENQPYRLSLYQQLERNIGIGMRLKAQI